jgi:hypothetical protein
MIIDKTKTSEIWRRLLILALYHISQSMFQKTDIDSIPTVGYSSIKKEKSIIMLIITKD